MADKPQITATIKFRGVTIEGMTVQELRELRDVLNTLVGEKVTERRVVEEHHHHDHYPYRRVYEPIWIGGWSVTSGSFTLGNLASDSVASNTLSLNAVDMDSVLSQNAHYTIASNRP